MNLFLHWLRRDLRRHALLIALWALLVALFTWARVWFRLHPWTFMPERDVLLMTPALLLGMLETCLLMRVLLDDPARGASAFWKTRPPSGDAILGAKLLVVLIVSLAIPLTAEGVFLGIVGPSADGRERFLLMLLPPVFALMAGTAASNWRSAMLWLPVSILLLGTVYFLLGRAIYRVVLFLTEVTGITMKNRMVYPGSDVALSVGIALGAAVIVALLVYRRRSVRGGGSLAPVLFPAVAMGGVNCTGWYPGYAINQVPPGVDPARITCTAVSTPGRSPIFRGDATRGTPFWSFRPEVTVGGLPAHTAATIYATEAKITPEGEKGFQMGGAFIPGGIRADRPGLDGTLTVTLSMTMTAEQAASLRGKNCRVSGTLRLMCYELHSIKVPLDGAVHDVNAGPLKWKIRIPAPHRPEFYRGFYSAKDAVGQWVECELIGNRNAAMGGHLFPQNESWSRLHNGNTGEIIKLNKWEPAVYSHLWEGSGATRERLVPIAPKPEETDQAYTALDKLCSDRSSAADWGLDFEVFTLSGVIDCPFSIVVPAAP